MLKKFDEAIGFAMWPKVGCPAFLETAKKTTEVPLGRSEKENFSFGLTVLGQEITPICEDLLAQHPAIGLTRFKRLTKKKLKGVCENLFKAKTFCVSEEDEKLAESEDGLKRNITLGLQVTTSLYKELLRSYEKNNIEPDFEEIEKACLKICSRIMQLENYTAFKVELLLGVPLGGLLQIATLIRTYVLRKVSFEVTEDSIDVNEVVFRVISQMMREDGGPNSLLSDSVCPAYFHNLLNTYVKYLTRVASVQRGSKQKLERVEAG